MMDGDKTEITTRKGYCSEYFAEKEAEKEVKEETKKSKKYVFQMYQVLHHQKWLNIIM